MDISLQPRARNDDERVSVPCPFSFTPARPTTETVGPHFSTAAAAIGPSDESYEARSVVESSSSVGVENSAPENGVLGQKVTRMIPRFVQGIFMCTILHRQQTQTFVILPIPTMVSDELLNYTRTHLDGTPHHITSLPTLAVLSLRWWLLWYTDRGVWRNPSRPFSASPQQSHPIKWLWQSEWRTHHSIF